MRRALKLLAAAALLLTAAIAVFGYHAAQWLKGDDAPINADAIVVLAGRVERALYAADLYREGYAPVVVLSEAVPAPILLQLAKLGVHVPRAVEIERQVLQAKGVPRDRIEPLGRAALSTVDEAEEIAARFGRAGRKIIIVTSPYHVLRARLIIARALEGRGVRLAVCATPYEPFPDHWWTSQDAAREVLLEWAKIVFYLAGGQFRAAPAP